MVLCETRSSRRCDIFSNSNVNSNPVTAYFVEVGIAICHSVCLTPLSRQQGVKNLTHEEGVKLAGIDPDYAKKDLYDSIEAGKFPSWTFYVQVSDK